MPTRKAEVTAPGFEVVVASEHEEKACCLTNAVDRFKIVVAGLMMPTTGTIKEIKTKCLICEFR